MWERENKSYIHGIAVSSKKFILITYIFFVTQKKKTHMPLIDNLHNKKWEEHFFNLSKSFVFFFFFFRLEYVVGDWLAILLLFLPFDIYNFFLKELTKTYDKREKSILYTKTAASQQLLPFLLIFLSFSSVSPHTHALCWFWYFKFKKGQQISFC